ncbi:hypothetical protein PHMEG_0006842 [Phytophthora megakarya]|uniref:Uncharacterized protein n=1 Tax=Phytophthora megakarya TaxID=4795 RepID=A0A225WQ34_9STRA|nr:hypothetical protein PHMEG_0006842 [Phytophthora megakarya]
MPHIRRSDGRTNQELVSTANSDYQDQMGRLTRKFPDTILWSGISEETPLDYPYRLNVAALRAKLKIRTETPKNVGNMWTIISRRWANPAGHRLTLLRLVHVDELEEVLRERQ